MTPLYVRRRPSGWFDLVDGVARFNAIKDTVKTVKCIIENEEGVHDIPVNKIILPKRARTYTE